jgi:3-oxoacid CoA-transferase subunit B
MEVTPNGLKLLELAPGVTVDEIKSKTAAKLDVSAV